MGFGTKLKQLRRQRDLTQEQLAEYLSISPQAVSRWETDAAMPDISLLPVLCNLFSVTSDELLGIDIEKKKERIAAISEEAGRFYSRGYYERAREILENGLREYPDSYRLTHDLMYIAYWQSGDADHYTGDEREACKNEAVRLGEAILAGCAENDFRHAATQVLCFLYTDLGNHERAMQLAASMPQLAVSREALFSYVSSGSQQYRAKQHELFMLLQSLEVRTGAMNVKLDTGEYAYSGEEQARLRDKQIALLHLMYEDGNFGFFDCHLSEIHISQAEFHAKSGSAEKALFHLNAAADHAIRFVKSGGKWNYTSLLFRGYDGENFFTGNTDNHAALILQALGRPAFDALQNTPELNAVRERLGRYADKWAVR